MKKVLNIIAIGFVLLTSCKSSNDEIFRAVKKEQSIRTEILVFSNQEYSISANDSIVEKGSMQLNGDKLILTPKPESSLITLNHNKEYKILDNKLCEIYYQNQETDSTRTTLSMPVEKVKKENCFKIEKAFKE